MPSVKIEQETMIISIKKSLLKSKSKIGTLPKGYRPTGKGQSPTGPKVN